jgi:hypothetical protein
MYNIETKLIGVSACEKHTNDLQKILLADIELSSLKESLKLLNNK